MKKRNRRFGDSYQVDKAVKIHNPRESGDYVDRMIFNAILTRMSQL